jgi:hypothetical protein
MQNVRTCLARGDGLRRGGRDGHFLVSFKQDGRTALIEAAKGGFTECVRLLIEAGADKYATDNVRGMRW